VSTSGGTRTQVHQPRYAASWISWTTSLGLWIVTDNQLQAQYTDLLLLNKHQLCSESELDTLHDHLSTLNEDTPRIKVSSESPITPELVFGLDTQLFSRQGEEGVDWEKIAGGGGWHGDEVETKTIWKGGVRPGEGKEHKHADGKACGDCSKDAEESAGEKGDVQPITKEVLEGALSKLSFEIYRGTSPTQPLWAQ